VAGRPVFSTTFINFASTTGTSSYTLPAGTTGIVRDMTFWLPSSVPPAFGSAITVALDFDDQFIWDIQGPNLRGGVYHWTGRQVFLTQMLVTCFTFTPFSFRACGYVLTPS
jgi:hypothetical protein